MASQIELPKALPKMKPWQPPVSNKQRELMRVCREKNGLRKYVLASGARWSSKSVGALHCVADHAWNTKNATISILCTSIPAGAEAGIWSLLTEVILPAWIAGEFGMRWAPRGTPRQHGVSKKYYCRVINKWGGESKLQLDSLKNEREVEDDFKNRYLTMIYWSEVSNFREKMTYLTLLQALRVIGTPEDAYVLLGDTNPSDEGTSSWIYKEWYDFRTADPSTLAEDERPRQKYLKLVEFLPDDNPFLTEDFKKQKRAEFASDPDLFARYWLGQWKKSSTDALFVAQFKRSLHVIGDSDQADPDILVPDENCSELLTGWDIGSANHAFVIAEKVYADPSLSGKGDQSIFKFIDEVVIIGEALSIWDFTQLCVERIVFWELFLGREIIWKHWSDRSAFDSREPISNRFHHEEVFLASGGRVNLYGVERRPGSLGQAIRLWRKMLFQRRLLFSAARCPKLVEMNGSLKKGKRPDTIHEHSPHKHPFDAARYLVMAECFDELQNQIITMRTVKQEQMATMISIPM